MFTFTFSTLLHLRDRSILLLASLGTGLLSDALVWWTTFGSSRISRYDIDDMNTFTIACLLPCFLEAGYPLTVGFWGQRRAYRPRYIRASLLIRALLFFFSSLLADLHERSVGWQGAQRG